MKKVLILLACVLLTLAAKAAEQAPFRFDGDGQFKIMQLTDLHFNGVDNWQSEHVPGMLLRMIRDEQPDLIVVTGDLIYRCPGAPLLSAICGTIASANIPYAVALGNHDAEQCITPAELYALIRTLPGCVNARYNAPDERQGDFVIPILSQDGTHEQARIYVMDSNDYNADDHTYKGFTAEQVAWYEARCSEAAERNGSKVNGLIFFHVPLPEFAEAYNTGLICGSRLEKECPPRDNTGMFRALVEGGEVTGIFAGHDHSNNYVAQKDGVALAYGQYSGGYAEYQELVSGSRLILLTEGKRGFTTWVHFANGRKKYRTDFPLEH